MRKSFHATEIGESADAGVISVGFAGQGHYITLQRWDPDAPNAEEDEPYIEFDDQLHSAFGAIAKLSVSSTGVIIDLAKPIRSLPDVDAFDIRFFRLDVSRVLPKLEQIFWDCGDILTVDV